MLVKWGDKTMARKEANITKITSSYGSPGKNVLQNHGPMPKNTMLFLPISTERGQ
jgi:hypothetical protein